MVSVRLSQQTGRPQLLIEVSDTGIGIPADRIQSLFAAFTQIDAATNTQIRRYWPRSCDQQAFGGHDGGDIHCRANPARVICFTGIDVHAVSEDESNTTNLIDKLRDKRVPLIDDHAEAFTYLSLKD